MQSSLSSLTQQAQARAVDVSEPLYTDIDYAANHAAIIANGSTADLHSDITLTPSITVPLDLAVPMLRFGAFVSPRFATQLLIVDVLVDYILATDEVQSAISSIAAQHSV